MAWLADHEWASLEKLFSHSLDWLIGLGVELIVFILPFQVFIKLIKRYLICWLVFAVVLAVLLHCIVSKMHKFIHVLCSILLAASSDIPFAIEPYFVIRVQCPHSDIEFPTVIEQRVDVLLNNICLVFRKSDQWWRDMIYQSQFVLMNCDAIASIRWLAWLQDI